MGGKIVTPEEHIQAEQVGLHEYFLLVAKINGIFAKMKDAGQRYIDLGTRMAVSPESVKIEHCLGMPHPDEVLTICDELKDSIQDVKKSAKHLEMIGVDVQALAQSWIHQLSFFKEKAKEAPPLVGHLP
jgi:hypothetical protein